MIKNILFSAAIIITSCIYAQNLDIKDDLNNSISGKTHYIYKSGPDLANTKFHVGNSSSNPINFDCSVWEMVNPTSTQWQVCFGTACYIANFNVSTAQNFTFATAPAGGVYPGLKVAPFSFGWVSGDYGVWRVRVFDNTNPSDSSTCYIVWTTDGTPCGDQNLNTLIDGTEIAGDLNLNGVIDSGEIMGDMNGNGIIDAWEVQGDENGNGIIDGAEVTSTFEFFDDSNAKLLAYPNPASNQLTINYQLEGNFKSAKIDIYDVLGQTVDSYLLNHLKGKLIINTTKLYAGVYFYALKVEGKTIKTERVIIE